MTASVLPPTCRQEEGAKALSGSPASITGPEGLVQEPDTPSQGVAAQKGSSLPSLSQGSGSGTYHPVCHTDGSDLACRQACPAQGTAKGLLSGDVPLIC